jgi:hypothetical protein
MNKNLILSGNYASNFSANTSRFVSNEYTSYEPTTELELIENTISSLAQKLSKTADAIKQPIEWLRKYYSVILEKEISMKQTALLLETQFAFAMAIMPADMHLLLRAASLGWFCLCLKRCKKSL